MLLQFLSDELGQRVDAVHTEHEVHVGVALAQLFYNVLLVGHAAAEADDEAVLLLFQALESAHVTENTLFGVLTDGAGVEKDEVGVLRFVTQAVADVHQHTLDALAVVDILLAAVAVDEGQRRGVIGQLDQLCRRVVMFKCYVLQ